MTRELVVVLLHILEEGVDATPASQSATDQIDQVELLKALIDLVAVALVQPRF